MYEGLLLVLLLIATTSSLMATSPVNIGDAISLRTPGGANYLTIIPGAANAGTISTTQSEDNYSVFQLLAANGSNPGGTVNYGTIAYESITNGTPISIRLPTNNLWLTLNPATDFGPDIPAMPYVRNNAPLPFEWEQFFFIHHSGGNGTTLDFNDWVYLARVDEAGNFTYLCLDSVSETAYTVTSFSSATAMLITNGGSLAPYTPPTPTGAALHYYDPFIINCGPDNAYNFNVHSLAANAGYLVDLTGTNTLFTTVSLTDSTSTAQIVYGAPLNFGPSMGDMGPMTMNPAPGRIRTNVTPTGPQGPQGPMSPGSNPYGVWEQLYFISVNGRNGDFMHYGDHFYVARNGLISGNFVTEYVTVDWTDPHMAMITTTTNFADATALTPTL